jgi:hypothetical protein
MLRIFGFTMLLLACGGSNRPVRGPTPGLDLANAKPTAPSDQPVKQRTGTEGGSDNERKVIDLDTIRIQATRKGLAGEPEMTSLATTDLFNQAVAAAKAGDGNRAIGLFRQLVTEFPESQFAPLALFNTAAIYDARPDLDSTLGVLTELVQKYPASRESVDGHLYMVALYTEHDRYVEALNAANELLARKTLSYVDQLEAQARKGYVQIELGQLEEADKSLLQAITTWRQIPKLEDPYFIAMAHYYRADILYRKFAAMPVRLPDEQLRKDLDAKEAIATQAYDRWKEALGFRHAYWATASGFRMSQIFVDFWRATVTAPYPRAMSVAARTDYVREVHERVRPQLDKALQGHQMNVELAAAYGVDTRWSNASKERAAEILATLAKEANGEFIKPAD